jgi:hypothetical protein
LEKILEVLELVINSSETTLNCKLSGIWITNELANISCETSYLFFLVRFISVMFQATSWPSSIIPFIFSCSIYLCNVSGHFMAIKHHPVVIEHNQGHTPASGDRPENAVFRLGKCQQEIFSRRMLEDLEAPCQLAA